MPQPFSLLVTACPSEHLLGRNVVFVHPNLHQTLSSQSATGSQLLIINGVAFASKPHALIQVSAIPRYPQNTHRRVLDFPPYIPS